MEEEEMRQKQIDWDKKSLNRKVRRWRRLPRATYGGELPRLLWEYVTMADSMFIDGYSIGVVLLCAAVVELILADQLISKIHLPPDEVQSFRLEEMSIVSHRLGIVSSQEKAQIDKIRRWRNAIVHVNAGRLDKMARKTETIEGSEAEFHLQPLDDDLGIHQDALDSLVFTKKLSVKFYGVER